MKKRLNAIDLFAGCGGLSEGMHQAGFKTMVAVEVVKHAADAYKMNHVNTKVIQKDIRDVKGAEIKDLLGNKELHLLAGCPPCQGFSTIRKLNKRQSVRDDRNSLVLEYLRLVKELHPFAVMMENVPGLKDYYLFKEVVRDLKGLGYYTKVAILNVKNFGVAQSRKRLVLIGSRLGEIEIPSIKSEEVLVKDVIASLPKPELSDDPLHRVFPSHSQKVQERIALTPKDGGSRKDLPEQYTLECHKKENVGFSDIYGRLRWHAQSTTITGGCLNPSKGRFLHPDQNRCISAREAALLQSFPANYKFPSEISRSALALLIGNALPPKFSYHQSKNIYDHLIQHL